MARFIRSDTHTALAHAGAIRIITHAGCFSVPDIMRISGKAYVSPAVQGIRKASAREPGLERLLEQSI